MNTTQAQKISLAIAEAIVQKRDFTALYLSDGTPTAARIDHPEPYAPGEEENVNEFERSCNA
jgi:hypothetical protein